MNLINLWLIFIFAVSFSGCGKGFENDPRDSYPKTKEYVPPFEREADPIQFHLPEDAVGIESASTFLFSEGKRSEFTIKAWIHFESSVYDLSVKNLPTWAQLTRNQDDLEKWMLSGTPPKNTKPDELELTIKLIVGEDTAPKTLNYLQFYTLEKTAILKVGNTQGKGD
mgnify:CR=1 FL=1